MLLLWWYGSGLMALLRQVRDHVQQFARSLNLQVLAKYLFVPMYGYNDIWSRLISFGVRCVQLVIVSIGTLFYIVLECILVLLWLAVPPVVLLNLLYQMIGVVWTQ